MYVFSGTTSFQRHIFLHMQAIIVGCILPPWFIHRVEQQHSRNLLWSLCRLCCCRFPHVCHYCVCFFSSLYRVIVEVALMSLQKWWDLTILWRLCGTHTFKMYPRERAECKRLWSIYLEGIRFYDLHVITLKVMQSSKNLTYKCEWQMFIKNSINFTGWSFIIFFSVHLIKLLQKGLVLGISTCRINPKFM